MNNTCDRCNRQQPLRATVTVQSKSLWPPWRRVNVRKTVEISVEAIAHLEAVCDAVENGTMHDVQSAAIAGRVFLRFNEDGRQGKRGA